MTIFTNLAVLCSGIAFVFFLFFAFQENKKVFAAGTMLVLASFICLTVPIAGMLHEHKLAFFSQPGSRYFLFAWILIIVYFIAVYKYRVRLLGILVMPLASILLLIAIRE
ncbi:MAG: hypothetical protein HRT89_14960 [Lentisphaeria bacterium]|nr:hypothetical protein [Lentisphaeria bacterium]